MNQDILHVCYSQTKFPRFFIIYLRELIHDSLKLPQLRFKILITCNLID